MKKNGNQTPPGKRGRGRPPKQQPPPPPEPAPVAKRRGRPPREGPPAPPTEKLQRLPLELLDRVHAYRERQENTTGMMTSVKDLFTEAWNIFEGSAEYECLSMLQWEQRKILRRMMFFLATEPKSVERQRLNCLLELIDEWLVLSRQFKGAAPKQKRNPAAKAPASEIRPDTQGGT